MNMQTVRNLALATLLASSLVGCGGGGSGSATVAPPTTAPPPAGGIDRGGVAVGVITGFGSIFVNGVEYETDSASITVDDNPGIESDLAVGDVVTVVGTVDDSGSSGNALSITFDDNVEGPVSSIDSAAGTLVVLGQTVVVTASTVFDNSSISPPTLAGIAVGDVVEVSGFPDASGQIEATRIEGKPPGGELEVRGAVSLLDMAGMTFQINALIVDFGSAQLDDFPGGIISDGDPVEVKGVSFDASGALVATRVEFETAPFDVNDGDNAEIEGFVTRFASASDFDVAGRAVTTTTNTTYFDGSQSELRLNVKVEAEGAFNASGVLVASKIVFKPQSSARIAATVDAIDTAAGQITLLGIAVIVDAVTQFEDDSDAGVTAFNLSDINVGDFLEVRGFEDPANSGRVRASRVERDNPDDEVELRGFVQSVDNPNVVILGVTIRTSGSTQFEDVADNPISAVQFFSTVQVGSLVEAQGVNLGGRVIAADEVEFEN